MLHLNNMLGVTIFQQGFTYVAPSVMDSLNREIPMSPWRYTRYSDDLSQFSFANLDMMIT